jgi:hypothetical protein
MLPPELTQNAFRARGEFGWSREQIPRVVEILRSHEMAILGGELWYVRDGDVYGSVPQRDGVPGLYTWTTDRRSGESWKHFVERGGSDALAAVERWPEPQDLPSGLSGLIFYNLTWVSETEFSSLENPA